MSFIDFLSGAVQNPVLLITVLLTCGVVFVNGCTDAPNAIATCIATRAISPKAALMMAAVFNFLGVFVMTMINSTVAMTIKNLVNFDGNTNASIMALCAALVSIILWSSAAIRLGIPTSESHALVAGLSGSAIALCNGFSGVNGAELLKVLYGLVLSTAIGFASGFFCTKLTEFFCRNVDRRKTTGFFRGAQVFGGAAMSFMHGAHDGQKFMGVMLLGVTLASGNDPEAGAVLPIWMMILCSCLMAFGTSVGGYKIIKSVGMRLTSVRHSVSFSRHLPESP